MCRNCGSIVGAGQSQCAVCGATTSTSQPATTTRQPVHVDRETIRFARVVLDRPYKFTIVLLIANFFVYLLMWESSGVTAQALWQQFPEPVLIAYGAKLNYLINAPYREWWRFVSPMFVHVNLMHLLVNMYSLWMVGPYVEKLYGSAKFVVFWVVTGIAGVLASYLTVRPNLAVSGLGRFLFKSQDVASAGASGALFGLVGVLFIFGIKFRHELPEGFKRAFGTGMLPIILINLFIGYLGRGFIDNAAHLGGLLSGAGLALAVQYRRPGENRGVAITWRVLQVAALGLLVLSFYKVARNLPHHLQPVPELAVAPNNENVFVVYVNAMNQLQEAVDRGIYDKDIANADRIANNASMVRAPDSKATELRDELLGILAWVKADVLATRAPQNGPERESGVDQQLVSEYAAWKKGWDQWIKTTVQPEITSSP